MVEYGLKAQLMEAIRLHRRGFSVSRAHESNNENKRNKDCNSGDLKVTENVFWVVEEV